MRSKKQLSTKQVAFGALCSALIVVFLSVSALIPTLDLTLAALAAFVVYVLLLEFGSLTAFLAFLASAALSLVLLPNKDCALFYTCFFGWYPFARSALSKIPVFWSWVVKIVLALVCGGLFCLFFLVLFPVADLTQSLTPVFAFLFLIAFILYEIGLGRWILFYRYNLRPKLFGK